MPKIRQKNKKARLPRINRMADVEKKYTEKESEILLKIFDKILKNIKKY